MPIRHTWSESDRYVPRTIVQPVQRLLANEAAGGAVMLVAAAVALLWANSPWSASYTELWSTTLRVELGDLIHLDHLSLQTWVNDALMAVFFLLVGVEIKREVVHGDLRDVRSVALPVVAALGGMVVPAAIYAAFNAGGEGANGWGIPMATDIAFAVGVVTLLGRRVPLAAKVFLLTLAVADDIGAIVVIAVFYTGALAWGWLAAAVVGLGVIFVLRRGDVQALAPYLAVGAFVWLALLESGVHATLAGVALGLLTPAWPLRSPRRFPAAARRLLDQIDRAYYDRVLTAEEFERNEQHIAEVARLAMYATSPLERLEAGLSKWVSFVIVPVFALANAGVRFSGDAVAGLLRDPVVLGVSLGLVVGKTAGVFAGAWIGVKLGIGRLPAGTTWRHVFGLAICAGIGFTVALFVTSISLTDPAVADAAKIGILLGSAVSGIAGYLFLKAIPLPEDEPAQEAAPARPGRKWTVRAPEPALTTTGA
ncbi:MAG TPA: Na+/H+ antiporter NhaA [Acidimicrobiales bacterium]|nr:Na+/H+ antiporter NhaA [Acidimicrobiales bacterium]